MSFTFQIAGHFDGDDTMDAESKERVIYDLAVRMVRKARELGATPGITGSFQFAGGVDVETFGVDPPEVPQPPEPDEAADSVDVSVPAPAAGAGAGGED